MNYDDLRSLIKKLSQSKPIDCEYVELKRCIFNLSNDECASIILDIGAIPEDIVVNSSEEKLYSKASEILLSRIFQELGLDANEIKKRRNCPDVNANSQFHNYSLVADAKTFRLSRTAKNQKDLKVTSLAKWRDDYSSDYAILVCPYYQYLRSNSDIYEQALVNNVCLLSWEFMSYLLQYSIRETPNFSLSSIWNISKEIAKSTDNVNQKQCFLSEQNDMLKNMLDYLKVPEFDDYLVQVKENLIKRGEIEIQYCNYQIEDIKKYTRKQAIDKLLSKLGLRKKITTIQELLRGLK